MVKRKLSNRKRINFSNKIFYTLATLFMIGIGIIIVNALASAPSPGHIGDEIGEGTIGGVLTVINGKVGVGNDDPQEILDVNGQLNVAGEIKIASTGTSCDSSNVGTIRWDGSDFSGCDGNSWKSLTGGSASGSFDLVYGQHSSSQCTGLGGSLMLDSTNKFCKFSGGTCPTSWAKYLKWSTTTKKSCTGGSSSLCTQENCPSVCCGAISCSTLKHVWGNTKTETCTYSNSDVCIHYSFCMAGFPGESKICTATVTEIGCY